jgi:hypothetical protein
MVMTEEMEKAIRELKYSRPLSSKEYRKFLIEEFLTQRRESLYERACNFSEKIFRIRGGAETERKFSEAIRFCYMNISPCGPLSLISLIILITVPLFIALTLVKIFDPTTIVAASVLLILSCYYLYSYPFFKVRVIRAKASTEIVLTVLYMAVALREIPNLENAVVFAASNISGPLSHDLKRVLWKIETQQISMIEEGLDEFTKKWGKENEEFVNAIKLLKSTMQQPQDRAYKVIDESIEVILNGTTDRMNRYAQDLRLPVMVIYALGIILPVLTLVMFPILMIFLSDAINIPFLMITYDILLPVSLFWFINTNLKAKPPTISQPDIGQNLTEIKIGSNYYSVFLVTIPILLILGSIGAYLMMQYHIPFSECSKWQGCNKKKSFDISCKPESLTLDLKGCKEIMTDILRPTISSCLLMLSVSFFLGTTFILMSGGRMRLREKIKNIESEFTEALFQLGHQMMAGHGVETALDESKKNLAGLEIANLYDKILHNIKFLGATFEGAIFNKEYGAVWQYPSEIIRSIMKIIVEASRKSLVAASTSMLTISRYLKGMRDVEVKIRDMLSETVTSMKFLAMVLSPLVAGITVGMAIIVMNIVTLLGLQIGELTGGGGVEVPGAAMFLMDLWKGGSKMGADTFQLVLGIYVIETTILIGMFVNGLENGEDRVSELNSIGQMLILSTVIYTISLLVVYSVFGGMMGNLLMGAV